MRRCLGSSVALGLLSLLVQVACGHDADGGSSGTGGTVSGGGAGGTGTGGSSAGASGGSAGASGGSAGADAAAGGASGSGGAAGASAGWKLVFQDDFDGAAIDGNAWSLYDSPGHAGNGLRSPDAISIEGGLLVITAQMKSGTLVSGGMAHKQNYKYGRFEFRVRTEQDPSATLSGVVLTWPQSGNWPTDGENDIYETGHDISRKPFSTFIHYGADNKQYYFKHDADAVDWHVMAMEWEADALRIYRDGPEVWSLADTGAIPDVPHHMTVQLDAFAKTMGGPVKMYVDWVKIFQR